MLCRIDKRRDWLLRLYHERLMHDDAVFVTLTYDKDRLPMGHSLSKADFQLFMKRLRQKIWRKDRTKVRFFAVGEYGNEKKRPHYHAIIFGYRFSDAFGCGFRGPNKAFRSAMLESTWKFGFSEFSDVDIGLLKYIAGYHLKKYSGDRTDEYYLEQYERVDYRTGEIYHVEPEFQLCSSRPGIGASWFEKFGKTDAVNNGFCVFEGARHSIPKYYMRIVEEDYPEEYERLVEQTEKYVESLGDEYSAERLDVKEEVARRIARSSARGSL